MSAAQMRLYLYSETQQRWQVDDQKKNRENANKVKKKKRVE